MKPIRIVIGYANVAMAHSLKHLLETRDTFRVVGDAHTEREALDLVMQLNPDVVVISLGLSNLNGLEVTRMIHNCAPKVGVILVTCLEPDHLQEKAAGAGALALLQLDQLHQSLAEAVISVHEGREFFPRTR